jgi:hypothetical protein
MISPPPPFFVFLFKKIREKGSGVLEGKKLGAVEKEAKEKGMTMREYYPPPRTLFIHYAILINYDHLYMI